MKGFLTILFTIKICKQHGIFQHVNEWISTPSCVHTMEYTSAMEINELLMHVTTWLNLRPLFLSQSEDIKQYVLQGSICSKLQHKATW